MDLLTRSGTAAIRGVQLNARMGRPHCKDKQKTGLEIMLTKPARYLHLMQYAYHLLDLYGKLIAVCSSLDAKQVYLNLFHYCNQINR
jgi:hypothetical protein